MSIGICTESEELICVTVDSVPIVVVVCVVVPVPDSAGPVLVGAAKPEGAQLFCRSIRSDRALT